MTTTDAAAIGKTLPPGSDSNFPRVKRMEMTTPSNSQDGPINLAKGRV
ncbi:MAG: hypothetical protein U1E37_08230 [Sphingomonadaceae bacterium]